MSSRRGILMALLVLAVVATVGGVAIGAPPSSGVAPGAVAPVTSCSTLGALDLSRVETSVGAAAAESRGGHDYCSVTGYISPQTRFEVLLPTATWRGDYLQQGCGGFCGAVGLSLTDPSRTSGYQASYPPLAHGEMVVAAVDQLHQTT